MRLWWIHCVIFLIWNSFKKIFWESQFDRKKKRPKTKRNKKDVAKLILPPLMCYSWKKTKRWMTLIWFLYYKWVCWGFFLFWLRCQKSFADDLPHLFYFFHAHTKKNPSASYLFNDGTTWAMSRWWICRMRQRARHQPRRNNCQHWVVVASSRLVPTACDAPNLTICEMRANRSEHFWS